MTAQSSVFILGFGSIGALLGVHLQSGGKTRVIPLFRSATRLNEFIKQDYTVNLKLLFDKDSKKISARFPDASCPEVFEGRIDNLIITCKTYQTKEAIEPYLPFLHNDSNIIMVQNGLGVLEVLREQVFNGDLKPRLFQGVIAHGVFQDPEISNQYNHAGFVDCKVAKLPSGEDNFVQTLSELEADEGNEMIKMLLSLKDSLNVIHMTYQELLLSQLEKFLVNCCMNSITSIVDCVNGELKSSAEPIFTEIIKEAIDIFEIAFKQLFQYPALSQNDEQLPVLEVHQRLNLERMVKLTMNMGCVVNGDNSSSMRQDVLNLRDTEIDYINGYLVTLCEKFHLPPSECKVNATIQKLVKLRLSLNRLRKIEGDKR